MSWLEELEQRRCQRVAKLGIAAGDFIQLFNCDEWREVSSIYALARGTGSFHKHPNTAHFFFYDVVKIHRRDDPWDMGEVRFVSDSTGIYGSRNAPPVPRRYWYAGPIHLSAWAWKLRRYAYSRPTFKNPARNEQFLALNLREWAERINEPWQNLDWDEARRIARRLKTLRDSNGWSPCVTYEAMEVYRQTLSP
jgi:hypothetical protein